MMGRIHQRRQALPMVDAESLLAVGRTFINDPDKHRQQQQTKSNPSNLLVKGQRQTIKLYTNSN
jgi:2,4-dienoyl-CoA reductase-like NADH-dependent reductase (Old Yellow Enzyme family)